MPLKFLAMLATASMMSVAVQAAEADPVAGYFGRIDEHAVSGARPEVLSPRAVKGQNLHTQRFTRQAVLAGFELPVYLHVRAGEEMRWAAHCAQYDACQQPVLFVSERWFRDVYLPAVGRDDGREQRYRDLVRPERNGRDQRHRDNW